MRLRYHGDNAEVEGGKRLGRIQVRFGTMTLDSSFGPLGKFMLEQRTKKPGRRDRPGNIAARAQGGGEKQSSHRGRRGATGPTASP